MLVLGLRGVGGWTSASVSASVSARGVLLRVPRCGTHTAATFLTPEEMLKLRTTISQLVDHTKEDRKVMEEYLGVPVNHLARKVKIYKPEKSATQHGYSAAQSWVLQFNPGDKWTNPLMGWTSTRDPLEYLNLKFPTKEAAIAFGQEQGFEVEVEDEVHSLKRNVRSYGNKFKHIPQPPRHISDYE